MPVEATSHQHLAIGHWASYLFCSPPWPCCWDLHYELSHTACISFRERGHGNATPSGPCLSSFPSLCHWGYRESAHKSRSPQRLDSSWTRDCLSCFDWIPWGYSQRLGLKRRTTFTKNKTDRDKGILAHRWKHELCWVYRWVVLIIESDLASTSGHLSLGVCGLETRHKLK